MLTHFTTECSGKREPGRGPEEAFDDSPRFADAMAASQLATEEAILEAARRLLRATGSALKGIPT